jgi:hypothetical protein
MPSAHRFAVIPLASPTLKEGNVNSKTQVVFVWRATRFSNLESLCAAAPLVLPPHLCVGKPSAITILDLSSRS